ncbi:hypothetical protein [Nonomuraea sp. JJY05]|uniref:hypothetical protein n=1 Tax=Nonomuraea sp. JJY05 TaxID=3350255 RepID=UPI00373F27B1
MSTSTLPSALKRIAEETAAAHDQVTKARKKHNKAAQRRNLAVFTLYHVHEQKKVAPLSRLAAINRVDFYKLLKKAPVPSTLRPMSLEEAKAVVAKQVDTIAKIAVEEESARERRIRGVLKLSQARIDGEPLTNADIAKATNMSATMVGTDLEEAAKRGYVADDAAEAGAEEAESPEMIPLRDMAKRLGTSVERILARVAAVRKSGGTIEGMSRVGSRVMMADPAVFTAWWERLHLGWMTLSEFAERRGSTYEEVFARLHYARTRHGLDLTRTDEYGGADLYDPEPLAAWWDSRPA